MAESSESSLSTPIGSEPLHLNLTFKMPLKNTRNIIAAFCRARNSLGDVFCKIVFLEDF